MAGDKLAWVVRIILNLSQVTRRESELSWFCHKWPAASPNYPGFVTSDPPRVRIILVLLQVARRERETGFSTYCQKPITPGGFPGKPRGSGAAARQSNPR